MSQSFDELDSAKQHIGMESEVLSQKSRELAKLELKLKTIRSQINEVKLALKTDSNYSVMVKLQNMNKAGR